MGIQSTIKLTREEAELKLLHKLSNVKEMSDEEIADLLDEEFHNYMII